MREVPGAGCRPPRDPRPVKIAMDTLPPRTAGAVSYIHSPGRQVASGSTCDSFPGRRPDRFIRYEVQQFCTQSCSLCAGLVHVLEPVPEYFSGARRPARMQHSPCRFHAAIRQLASPLRLACVGRASIGRIGRHTHQRCLQCGHPCSYVRMGAFLTPLLQGSTQSGYSPLGPGLACPQCMPNCATQR